MIKPSRKKIRSAAGFTIVELLVAISVFSIMLLITSGVMVELGRQFYKTVVRSRTQEVSRSVVEELANNLQYSASDPYELPASGNVMHWCIAGRLYSYVLNQEISPSTPNVLLRSSDCQDLPSDPLQRTSDDQTELLADNMRLTEFSLVRDDKAWYISITVAHGDDEAFDSTVAPGDPVRCRPDASNSTYCAVSSLSTVVVRKL
jgi:prepilin-type N-terminal cleavage/methylation domain-containing protein